MSTRTSLDEELDHKLLLLFQRMSVCAATHQGKDAQWIDGQCVTPTTASRAAMQLFKDYLIKDRAERDKFVLEPDGMVGTDNLPDPYNISPEIQRVVKERIVRRAKQWDNISNTTNKEEE